MSASVLAYTMIVTEKPDFIQIGENYPPENNIPCYNLSISVIYLFPVSTVVPWISGDLLQTYYMSPELLRLEILCQNSNRVNIF